MNKQPDNNDELDIDAELAQLDDNTTTPPAPAKKRAKKEAAATTPAPKSGKARKVAAPKRPRPGAKKVRAKKKVAAVKPPEKTAAERAHDQDVVDVVDSLYELSGNIRGVVHNASDLASNMHVYSERTVLMVRDLMSAARYVDTLHDMIEQSLKEDGIDRSKVSRERQRWDYTPLEQAKRAAKDTTEALARIRETEPKKKAGGRK